MKLKTLLLVVAILCVSLFVVACGDDVETTAGGEGEATTTEATTTVATTTKATTTKKTTTATTTAAATGIPSELTSLLPTKLPDNTTPDILHRISFDTEDDFLAANANATNKEFTATGAIYGKAFRFSSIMSREGTARRGEAYMDLLDPFSTEGIKGLLWYIDFSDVEVNPAVTTGLCTSVTFNTNGYRSKFVDGVEGSGIGYYYKDGVWTETKANVNACRMPVPEKFKGWIYVPITSYTKGGSSTASGDLFDASTKVGLSNVFVTNFRVYTDGYTYSDDHYVLVDELLYLK